MSTEQYLRNIRDSLINNNIQEHFIDHVNKYVNITFDIKATRDEITKNNKDKAIRKQFRQ